MESSGNTMHSDLSLLDGVLDKYADVKGSLITILQKAQDIYGYLPADVLQRISDRTAIKPAEILGVATFYSQFRLKPVGKYLILLCKGTACHVNGSDMLEETIVEKLGIHDGETTEDGLFTLKIVECLGCCSLSPVMMINGEAYGLLTPQKTKDIIDDLTAKAEKENESVDKVVVGMGSCGVAAGAQKVYDALAERLASEKDVKLSITGCIGMCFLEPIVDLYSGEKLVKRLVHVSEKDVETIGDALHNGNLSALSKLEIKGEDEQFLTKQTRIALRHCGIINPESLNEYLNADGFKALKKVLLTMTPDELIEEIKVSGLSGRGGAGFPTWFKWNEARKSPGTEKYLICNADEGDPGAFMDRAILEGDPFALLEGMLIGAYAIGAGDMIIYVRAEYPLAIKRLEKAIDLAEKAGFIGEHIFGSDFSCRIQIKAGAGAFVCGEETALIESLEGHRGMPRLKPPFPAQSGFWRKPSNINNVETFANVAWIILNGGEAFAKIGTPGSKGTKIFALTGKVCRGGLVEVPMGKTLREVIFDIGGGIKNDKKFKAVQLGGPSGGCLPESLLDTIIDYKALSATGAIMGSGGMVVMDETTCMVGIAKFFLHFTAKESCGKCIHCRLGTQRMLEVLTRITNGDGREGDIELLEELCVTIKDGALCGLGQTAPNPVLTAIRYFRDEFEAHISEKRCPAGECTALISYAINKEKCIGCGVCAKKCPVHAIQGTLRQPHSIDSSVCIKCGRCLENCKFGAVEVR